MTDRTPGAALGGWRGFAVAWGIILLLLGSSEVRTRAAIDPGPLFDSAARAYEQGNFAEAAAAYDRLLTNGVVTPSVHFNQGNAWWKAGRKGRAIASFLAARGVAPRDSEIAANLRFARSQIPGVVPAGSGIVDRLLDPLTAAEWAVAATLFVWAWLGLLIAREAIEAWRRRFGGWCWGLGCVALGLLSLALLSGRRERSAHAVVVAPEAAVRFGPLEESKPAFTLPDGAELEVVDAKGEWLEIRDTSGRRGWMAARHVLRVGRG